MRDGSFYVSDGYRNTRVAKYSADGAFELQFGAEGNGPAQFHTPHSLAIGRNRRIYVCDRNNARVQILDLRGGFLGQLALPALGRPFAIAAIETDRLAVAGNRREPGKPETAEVMIIDVRVVC